MNLSIKNLNLKKHLTDLRIVELCYLGVLLAIPLQKYLHNHYNNFTIFRYSTHHFFAGTNMYLEYPKEYYDVFLYAPSFPVFFAPFAYLPVFAGILTWVAVTLFVFYLAVRLLPFNLNQRLFIYGFTFLELVTSAANLQSNPLVTAFILFTFIYLERESAVKAGLYPGLGFFIKGYGIISGALLIARRSEFKYYLWAFIWILVLACLPLIHYSPAGLLTLYSQWGDSLFHEHSINKGISVMGMISSLFSFRNDLNIIQLAAIICVLLTIIYIFFKKNYDQVKAIFLSYLMIFIVIFNHDAESSTYLIASTGVAIWYVNSPRSWFDNTLLIITFILTVLSPSDIFPAYLRRTFVGPYCLKALGPFLVWLRIQFTIFSPEKKQLKPANG
jgi:hypothetical protein